MDYEAVPGARLYVAALREERMRRDPEYRALQAEIVQDRKLMEEELLYATRTVHLPHRIKNTRESRSIDELAA